MTRAMRRMRKYLLVVACIALIAGVAIGGTIAWLTATTTQVVNTFSPSNIGLRLDETSNSGDYDYKMVPGTTEAKNPTVTISGDVDAWLFVEIDESWTVTDDSTTPVTQYALNDYIAYTLNLSGWNRGDGNDIPNNVWYISVTAAEMPKTQTLLKAGSYEAGGITYNYEANTVAFKADVTKEMMALISEDDKPTLEFKAYAVQKDGLDDPADAWDVRSTTAG